VVDARTVEDDVREADVREADVTGLSGNTVTHRREVRTSR